MTPQAGSRKRKVYRWVGFWSVLAAILGGIDLFLDPTLLDIVVEIILLANVGIHWKYIFERQNQDEQGTSR